jgi:hypothetical protein
MATAASYAYSRYIAEALQQLPAAAIAALRHTRSFSYLAAANVDSGSFICMPWLGNACATCALYIL